MKESSNFGDIAALTKLQDVPRNTRNICVKGFYGKRWNTLTSNCIAFSTNSSQVRETRVLTFHALLPPASFIATATKVKYIVARGTVRSCARCINKQARNCCRNHLGSAGREANAVYNRPGLASPGITVINIYEPCFKPAHERVTHHRLCVHATETRLPCYGSASHHREFVLPSSTATVCGK